MDDLISRNTLLEAMQKLSEREHGTPLGMIKWFIEIIIKAPTVKAKPIVYGKWRKYKDVDCVEFIKCTICGGMFYDEDNDTFDRPYNFCPDCGSDMRGGKNE